MLTDTESLCLSSSSIEWSVCWRGGPSSLWDGVIWFSATSRLFGHNSELSEHVSHTPHSSWGTGSDSVCDWRPSSSCCVSWALRWQCVGTARMQHPAAGSRGIPLLTQGRARGIRCHINVKPEARLRLKTDESFGDYRSVHCLIKELLQGFLYEETVVWAVALKL